MKVYFRIGLLILFIIQIVYLSYHLPQIILLDFPFTAEVKLSAAMAGILIGVLFFTKGEKLDIVEDGAESGESEPDEEK